MKIKILLLGLVAAGFTSCMDKSESRKGRGETASENQ